MGIQAQICGLILLIIIELLTILQPRIQLKTQKLFMILLGLVIVSIILDGGSILVIRAAAGNYGLGTRIFCKTYLSSLALAGWYSFLYFSMELDQDYKYLGIFKIAGGCWTTIAIALIYALPIRFHDAADGIYTYGASVGMTYAAACSAVVMNIVVLVVCKKHMDERRWTSGILWMLIWVVAAVIQFANNQLLLVGYAGALGVSILFLKLENPEAYLDRRTGLFNEQALQMFLEESYQEEKPFYHLRVMMEKIEYQEDILKARQMEMLVHQVSAYFEKIKGAKVFKHAGWEYSFLFMKENDLHEAAQELKDRFEQSWVVEGKHVDMEVVFIKVPDCYIVSDANQLLEFVRMFGMHIRHHNLKGIQTMEKSWIKRKEDKVRLVNSMQEAIKEDRVEVFYQPIYSTEEKRFVSAEALARIRNKDGSILPPASFIPVAESNGMILQIGEIVFRKTCQFILSERLWEKGIYYIEINLSALQCSQPELADQYIQIMEETGVDPSMINLEITESAALSSKEILLANMEKLSDYGVTFSLDDFGTGYSNLNYILELPVQIVKFDRQMTVSYFENEKGKLVMDATIRMIKAVGMRIVSEGVETKEQLDVLTDIQINYIQGFYFSKPVCSTEFLKLLA